MSLFDTLSKEFAKSPSGPMMLTSKSRKWFTSRVKQLGDINRTSLLDDRELTTKSTPTVGHMFMFVYDPKHKKTLPYYDKFPLIIMVDVDEKKQGFYGLNLHYLNPKLRAAFLDALHDSYGSTKGFTSNTRVRATYSMLKNASNLREFKPCFKHYLFDHVQSKFAKVDSPDWEIAIFLPTENFEKASKNQVWSESRKKI